MVSKMSYIASNERLITHLSGNGGVRDFMVYQFRVFENDNQHLIADVYLKVQHKGMLNHIKLRFMDIREYQFHYKDPNYLYYIRVFTYLKEKGLFYFGFDTVGEQSQTEPASGNFIFARAIEGFSFHEDV